jgi:hypothetical protein
MSATLSGRELIEERRTVDEFLVETQGELTPELEALLNDVTAKIEDKIEATARFVLSEQARADAIKAEEVRLSARRKAIESRVEYNKAVRIRALLDVLGVDKVKGALVTVALQNCPPTLTVNEALFDDAKLRTLASIDPDFVVRAPETFRLNRIALLAAHKAGQLLPTGCDVVVNRSVRIR